MYGESAVNRQVFGALIVTVAVGLGLVVALVVIPMIQPGAVKGRQTLDRAADQAARRLEKISRQVEQALAAERLPLSLPAEILQPSDETLQRMVAKKPDLLRPVQDLQDRFGGLLRPDDERYRALSGKSAPAAPESAKPPVGQEAAQVAWLKQEVGRAREVFDRTVQAIDTAVADLRTAISSVSTPEFAGPDHFRANWLLGALHYQKALLLHNRAAARRTSAERVRSRIVWLYRQFAEATGQAEAIASRLGPVSLPAPSEAAPAPVPAAEPSRPAPEPQAKAPGVWGKLDQLLRAAREAAAQPEPSPAEPKAPREVEPPVVGQRQEPLVVLAGYAEELDRQRLQVQRRIADLHQRMAEPKRQLQQTQRELRELQEKLAALEEAGYDVTDPASFQKYKESYTRLGAAIRRAEVEIQALQEGTLAGARLDPASAGDLLRGRYVGGTPQVGLNVLQDRLAVEQQALADLQEALKDLQALREVLEQRKQQGEAARQKALRRAGQVREQLGKEFETLGRLIGEAEAFEEQALQACGQARAAFRTALQAARKQQSDAQRQLQIANPSPEKPNLRLEQIRDYTTPEAAAEQGLVDVFSLEGQIHLHRAVDLGRHRGTLELLQTAGIKEIDLADTDKKIQQALQRAIAALDKPDSNDDALGHAANFSRLIGRQRFAWLGPAMRGVVLNLAAQVEAVSGQISQAQSRRQRAIEALQEATRDKENSELLQPYMQLLSYLQGGAGS